MMVSTQYSAVAGMLKARRGSFSVMRVALFLALAVHYASSPVLGQEGGHITVVTRVGGILSMGNPVVWDTVTMDFGPGLELGAILEWKTWRNLGVRMGLLGGVGSRMSARYDGSICAGVLARRPTSRCAFDETAVLLHLFTGPSYRSERISMGLDGGARLYHGPWSWGCEDIESLCTAMTDYTEGGPTLALHPYLGLTIPTADRILQLELGSFVSSKSSQTLYDMSLSLGVVW